jgi:hypothetical protein
MSRFRILALALGVFATVACSADFEGADDVGLVDENGEVVTEENVEERSDALSFSLSDPVLPWGRGIAVGKKVEFKANVSTFVSGFPSIFYTLNKKDETKWTHYSTTRQRFTGPGITWDLQVVTIPGVKFGSNSLKMCRLDYDIDLQSDFAGIALPRIKQSFRTPETKIGDLVKLLGISVTFSSSTTATTLFRAIPCTSFFHEDESNNGENNNRTGLSIREFGQEVSLRPKREDRTRMWFLQAGKSREVEFDTEE